MREHSTLALLSRLIAFPTVSTDTNLPLIEFVANYLADFGIQAQVLRSSTQPKANLLATIGPCADDGVILSGHTDVVPVEGQQWSSSPFETHLHDAKVYGRGSADMKGFIAAALSRIPTLPLDRLRRPIHLALSYDEEIGCLGAQPLIESMRERIAPPQAVIVGEPTQMRPVVGHKGVQILRTHVFGQEAHSSVPHLGVNAIALATDLTQELRRIEQELAASSPGDARFCPRGSTISINMINGGTATNIVPRHCSFLWDIREIPEAPASAILDRFHAHCARLVARHPPGALSITTEVVGHVPALPISAEGAAHSLAAALLDDATHEVMCIGSEAGLFQAAGYSVILCGPGSIVQAHKPDEFVALDQLQRCEAFMDGLIAAQCDRTPKRAAARQE